MNKIHAIASATLASLALSVGTAFAASADQTLAPKQEKPVPVKIVNPTNLPTDFKNCTVEFALTIDENGVPHNVKPARWMPRDLAARLVPVVSQWRFTPNYVNGRAVSARFILPIELVEGAPSGNSFGPGLAANVPPHRPGM